MAACTTTTRPRNVKQAFAEYLASINTMIAAERALEIAYGAAEPAVADRENAASEARDGLQNAFNRMFERPANGEVEALFSHLGFVMHSVVTSETPEEYARMHAFAAVTLEMAPVSQCSTATPDMPGLVSEARRLLSALSGLEHYGGPGTDRSELIPA